MNSRSFMRYIVREKNLFYLNKFLYDFMAKVSYGKKVTIQIHGNDHVIDTSVFEEYLYFLIIFLIMHLQDFLKECEIELSLPSNGRLKKETEHLFGFLTYFLLFPSEFNFRATDGLISLKEPIRGYKGVELFYRDEMIFLNFKKCFYAKFLFYQFYKRERN